jgi:glycosyltransferase involved in cell wall biosynthesis
VKIAVLGSRHLLSGYSGIERGLRNILPHLVAKGHEVSVFSGPPPAGMDPRQRAAIEQELRGIRFRTLGGLNGKYTETLSRTALSMAGVMSGSFDVALFTHQGPAVFTPVAHAAGTASVVWVQGLDWQRAKWGAVARRAIRGAEQISAMSADSIVVASRKIQGYFDERYRRNTTYIPGGIESMPASGGTGCLEKFGLQPREYLLFVARLVPEKACHELIQAWQAIDSTMKLVIAGAGRSGDPYVTMLHGMADPSRVIFTGHVDSGSVSELLSHAYAFVLPSYLEGQSVALLEALGAGRAALVSDIPENLEAIEPGGFTFRVGDVDNLKAKLAWLLEHPDAVRAMEETVVQAIRSWPNWRDVALMHEAAYEDAVARRRSKAPAGQRKAGPVSP